MEIYNTLLPVLIVIALGFLMGKLFKWDAKPLSQLGLYLLVPPLVFRAIYQAEVTRADFLQVFLFIIFLTLVLIAVTILAAKVLKQNEKIINALILSTTFMNVGNFGLPVILFAFGEEGMKTAIILYLIETSLMFILAVYFAAKGKGPWWHPLVNIFKSPPVFGLATALIFRWLEIEVAGFPDTTVNMLADAAIPFILLSLGVQLANTKFVKLSVPVFIGVTIRMILSPLAAYGVVKLLGVGGVAALVMIVQTSTPTGVLPTMYAIEYDTYPELVSMITLITTPASFLTLAILLNVIM